MFLGKSITGSIVWGSEEIGSTKIQSEVEKYKRILVDYRDHDKPVALYIPRGKEFVYCILALLEGSVPFITIDIGIPESRIRYMLNHIGVKYIISTHDLGSNLTVEGIRIKYLENIVLLKEEVSSISDCEAGNGGGSEIAYYLYTSGTTGNPKAVMISKSALYNFINGIDKMIPMKDGQRILNLTSVSFDIVFLEIIYSLYSQLTVVLTSDYVISHIKEVCSIIVREQIDIIQMTPSRLKMIKIIDPEFTCLSQVKFILVGGEMLPKQLLIDLKQFTDARIYNMYGPTETTIWSSCGEIVGNDEIHIGTPLNNTSIYILDKQQCEKDEGEIGEICIGGTGLTDGYYNDPQANKKVFLLMPSGERVYKTGDLGCWKNGKLYCYGRIDNQIKLNGHRIELEDIDANIERLKWVKQVATCFDVEQNHLVTYYTGDKSIEKQEFIQKLKQFLPDYMVPSYYIKVGEILYTISNKIDRKKMLYCYALKADNHIMKYEDNCDFGKKIIKIFEAELAATVNLGDCIEDIVPDSIVFISIIVKIENEFHIEFNNDKLEMGELKTVQDVIKYTKELMI